MAFQLTIIVRCNKILKTRTIIKTSALRNLFDANAFLINPFGFDLDSYHKNKYVSAVDVSEIENNFL